jgi:hypothetical protein
MIPSAREERKQGEASGKGKAKEGREEEPGVMMEILESPPPEKRRLSQYAREERGCVCCRVSVVAVAEGWLGGKERERTREPAVQ